MFGIMNGYVEIAEKLVHSKYVAKTDTRELGISDVLPVAYEKEQEKLDSVYTILEYLRLPSLLQLELTIVTDMIGPPGPDLSKHEEINHNFLILQITSAWMLWFHGWRYFFVKDNIITAKYLLLSLRYFYFFCIIKLLLVL